MEYVQSIKPDSAEILTKYIKLTSPKRILEIGTGEGRSGILMLAAAPADATLTTIEKNESTAMLARKNFEENGLSDRVILIQGDAAEMLEGIFDTFDFIFLDGPKGQYIKYLPRLKDLLEEGGVLAADNVLFRDMILSDTEPPKEYRTIVTNLRHFLQELKSDRQFETTLYFTGDGISVSVKEKL